jgi:M6 family metalloprotease-like protein
MRGPLPKLLSILLTLLIVTQGLPRAAFAGAIQSQGNQRLVQDFHQKFGRDWIVKLSADGQRIESILGRGTQSYRGKPAEAALQFLRENARFFGLKEDLSDLNKVSEKTTLGGGNVEFQQVYNGLPIENARVQVNLNREGRIIQIVNSYMPISGAIEQAKISKEQAAEIAIAEFLRTTPASERSKREKLSKNMQLLGRAELQLKEPPRISETFFVRLRSMVRAYKILITALKPFGVKEFVVDAISGSILLTRDREHTSVDGTGQVFIPNPVNSNNNNTYTDSGAGGTGVPTTNPNPYYTVSLQNLNDASGGSFTLRGPFAILEDIEAPSNTPPSESSASNFVYQRSNAQFDDVMLYYHIDRMQRYIQSLGFVDVNNRQIRVDSDGFSGADNSHYVNSPVGVGYLAFGHGGVDDAEDADVIAHEYGHAIQANVTQDKYDGVGFPRAMGEGFGDYWAVSSFFNETQASGHDQPCVMEWDQAPNCLRRVDENLTADDFVAGGDEHDNGQIWSRALWEVLRALGKTTADRLILQSHFNVPDNPTFKQAADAILTADLQLYSGSHLTQLCTVFTDRRIYGAGDCPSVPPLTGAQNTLVVLARFNDAGLPASPIGAGNVTTLINNINSYLNEVTYAQVSLGAPNTQGWLNLPRSRAQYYDQTSGNMLIEMVQDVITALPGFDFSPYDRMIILTNDDGSSGEVRGLKEWATTGPWPYTLPAAFGTKRLSVSIHRADQAATGIAQFTHAMGHHFGLIDLYAHEGVTFPRPYADGWGNMAKAPPPADNFINNHFFGWDKLRPTWLNGSPPALRFISRPPADPDVNHRFEETIPIFREEQNASNPVLIQVGTTPGATHATERASYYIEARKTTAGTFDSGLPTDGVLVYYLNEDISQGFGPLRLVDATPGTSNDLSDAAFQPSPGPSTVNNIDGTGLNVEVLPAVGTEDYRIHITYDPPESQVDVWINPHDDNWKSPDIWVDNPGCNGGTCGFDLAAIPPRTETDRGDKPIAQEVSDPGAPIVNRAYARVYNHGPGTAHNVRVNFYFSDPYHGIDGGTFDPDTGGNIAFNKQAFIVLADVPPTETGIPVFVDWTPERVAVGQTEVHSCVKVKILPVFNDTNNYNQASQENIDEYDISAHSPYPPVVNPFKVVNPFDHPIFVYLRADNVPVGWTAEIVPKKAYIPVGGSIDAQTTIQAPLDYPVCSTEFIKTSAWYPSGDTLIELGATTAQVNLKKSTDLTVTTTVGPCNRNSNPGVLKQHASSGNCSQITTKGCTNPARPNEHITVEYTGPDGNPIYHDVITDANGCFEDFLVNPQGGIWTVQTQYPGDDCTSKTHTPTRPVFVPPGGTQGPGDFGRGKLWLSFHLGMNFPLGSFNKTHDPGPSMTLNAEYPFRDNLSAVGYLGFHYFHGDGGNPDFHYTNLSLNLKKYFPVSSFRSFVEAGPGIYFPKTGSAKFGFNVGAGFSFAIQPKFKFELGPDFHFVDPGGTKRTFVDARMGVAFRF